MNDSGNGQNIEEPSTVLSVLSDAVGDLVTGIPVPVRKNAIKAFTRLCTAAVEYPVTLIEGAIAENEQNRWQE
jgi:hypothetical protein